jgi:SagB-type dehydrogenase family enzyme
VKLPEPVSDGKRSLESALNERRSVRDYTAASLILAELAQLLWAAQGVTSPDGLRTAPSAGALYPLETYVAAGRVDGLSSGLYKYEPAGHSLTLVAGGDERAGLAAAALGQTCVETAAAVIAFAAVYGRTTAKYGERGRRYVHMEVGHAAQNVCLQATALGLGIVVVGAFDDRALRTVLHLARGEEPLGLVCVGRPR